MDERQAANEFRRTRAPLSIASSEDRRRIIDQGALSMVASAVRRTPAKSGAFVLNFVITLGAWFTCGCWSLMARLRQAGGNSGHGLNRHAGATSVRLPAARLGCL